MAELGPGNETPVALPAEIGPYKVLREIARGGMAAVYAVIDPTDGRQIGLKLLLQRGNAGLRFQREYHALARLDHPNILRVLRFGVAEGFGPYLTMELLDGQPAQVYAKSLGRPGSPERMREVLRVVSEIAMGLGYLHEHGIVHRDLKSSNVLVLADGAVKILDFGTARLLEEEEVITQAGEFVGTFAYASPEQLTGKMVDGRSDLYALGVLAYRLIVGKRPFEADTPQALARLHLEAEPKAPSEIVSGIPPELDELVLSLLEKDPADRPATPALVVERLSRWVPGVRLRARLPQAPEELGAIGREVEIQRIAQFLGNPMPGAMLALEAERGAGAGRLLEVVGQRARASGARVILETLGGNTGVNGLARIGRAAARALGGEAMGDAAGAVAFLARPREPSQHARRITVFCGLVAAWARQGAETGVMCLRELDQGPAEVTDALMALRRQVVEEGLPLVFVVTARPVSVAGLGARVERLVLPPLDVLATGRLVGELLGRAAPPQPLVRRIHAASGGRPGYTVEIVHAMLQQGLVVPLEARGSGGAWRDVSGGRVVVPESVRGALELHLDTLESGPARLLEVVALVGGGCPLTMAGQAVDRSRSEVQGDAEVLVAGGLCEWEAEGTSLRVALGLLVEVVRSRLRPARRGMLERKLAELLVDAPPTEEKVALFLAAGRPEEAVMGLVAWGRERVDRGDTAGVLAACQALLAVESSLSPMHLGRLLTLYGRVLGTRDPRDPEALEVLRRAGALLAPAERAEVDLTLAALHRRRGESGAAAVHRRRAEEEASRRGDVAGLLSVALENGAAASASGDARAALEAYDQAAELAALLDEPGPGLAASAEAGRLRVFLGDLRAGEEDLWRALTQGEQGGPPGTLADVRLHLGESLRRQGRYGEASQLLERGVAEARALCGSETLGRLLLGLAEVRIDLFRLGEAREQLQELEALGVTAGEPELAAGLACARGRILLASGVSRLAGEILDPALRNAEELGLSLWVGRLRGLLGLSAGLGGLPDEAARHTRAAGLEMERLGLQAERAQIAAWRAQALAGREAPARVFGELRGWAQREGARPILFEIHLAGVAWAAAQGDRPTFEHERAAAQCLLDELRGLQGPGMESVLHAHPWGRRLGRWSIDRGG